MKKILAIIISICFFNLLQSKAQGIVSDFDGLLLPMPPLGSYWNGSDQSGGFVSGGMYFPNSYDTSFGGYWVNGFAYSSVIDSTTSGFTNLYAAKPASGYNGSSNYAVVQQNAIARLNNVVPTMLVEGFYVTNGTYAYNSMRDGDIFARKFGDTTGTNSGFSQGSYPDFFKLTIRSYLGGQLNNDSVEFYLADFRFTNDSLDYILNTWEWVDCSILGVFDSLQFTMTSSDNGAFGMNTPAFFCLDNLIIDVTVGDALIESDKKNVEFFPNPAKSVLYFNNLMPNSQSIISVFNMNGQLVAESYIYNGMQGYDISNLPSGFYSIKLQNKEATTFQKFLKQ
jgi:hypothetical protein